MNYEEREERLFMLRLFKFVYQIVSVAFPPDLQKEYDKFPNEETGYFTETVTKAVLVLTNEKFDDVDDIPDIGSEEFERIVNDLELDYNPVDFLRFCSWFVLKAALGRCGETFDSYKTVWSALENIFEKGKGRGAFDVDTWDTLDKVASVIVQEDDESYQRDPAFNPYVQLNLEKEKAFVLRVMQYVFRLHTVELPEYYTENARILDEQDYNLSDEVRSALRCIVNVLTLPEKKLGEVALRNYYRDLSFDPFKAKEFLEYCVVFSKKALFDYYDFDRANTPIQVFESCVNLLRGVREKGLYTPWRKIEAVATDILEDHMDRLEDERQKEQRMRDLTKGDRRRLYEILKAQFGDDIDPPEEMLETVKMEKWKMVGMEEYIESLRLDSVESDESDSDEGEPCRKKKRKFTVMNEPKNEIRETIAMNEALNIHETISGESNKPESIELNKSTSENTERTKCLKIEERKQSINENYVQNINAIEESETVNAGQEKIENKFDHINCSCCKCS